MDPDLQIDIITELDLVNTTLGVTQVPGLHNASKAFLFQDTEREIHAAPHVSEKLIQLFQNRSEFTFLATLQQKASTSGVILSIRELEHSYFELESSGLRDEIRYRYRFHGKMRTEVFPYRLADGQWHRIAVSLSASHLLLHVDCNRIYERVIDPPETNLTPESNLWLGQRNRKHGFFKGVIQDVKIIFIPNGYITQCPNLNRTCPTCSDFLSLVQGIMDLQELLAKMTAKLNYAETRLSQLEDCHCEKTCQVNGLIYRDKDSWVEDDHCRNCTCKGGAVECRRMSCPPLECPPDALPVHVGSQCCKVCKAKCIYGGKVLAEGQRVLTKSCRECRVNELRSSFKQAFGKKKSPKLASAHSDIEEMTDSSLPSSPKLPHHNTTVSTPLLRASHSNSLISECTDSEAETVLQLRNKLRDKEMKLTDIRLEALSSAHQLDQLREAMNRMQSEIEKLKAENDRLKSENHGSCSRAQSQVSISSSPRHSVGLSQHSLNLMESTSLNMLLDDAGDGSARKEGGRHVKIVVSFQDEMKWKEDSRLRSFLIGCIGVSGKTKWDVLDGVVRRLFKVSVCENSLDGLVFKSLIPKAILQRYVSLLMEHKRIILSGPSGTGKTYLANRLSEYMVLREGRELAEGIIATFNVDHKSSKELRQYLSNLADQCNSENNAVDMPLVIILDNLHHVSSLGEIFNGLLNCKYHKCPYIIGTMNQATSSTPNLQLHHNFRWVLCANHTEPVKGFLGRFLRRKLIETEISGRMRNAELVKIIDWIPKVWQHLNKFLEAHSSSDVTIGPQLFLSCPIDVDGSRVWFTDLWNYSIIPYLLEAVREGLQLYGRRAPWEDPAKWVMDTYPWAASPQHHEWLPLLQLRPEDVGFDGYSVSREGSASKQVPVSDAEGDPLMNMLMRLQEAANYSSPQSYDSDSNSNSHHDDILDSSLESTL